jgi:hypothetical protein
MTSLAAIVLCELAAVAVSPVVIEFDGETYQAGFASNQSTVRLVEYVRAEETLENWTKLFALRNFPTSDNPSAAVAVFAQVVKQHNPQAGVQVLVKEDGSEAMIDFLTWAKGAGHMELNIHRYLRRPEYPGLISYQFAYRFRTTPDTTAQEIRKLKDHWCEVMREIDPPVQFGK